MGKKAKCATVHVALNLTGMSNGHADTFKTNFRMCEGKNRCHPGKWQFWWEVMVEQDQIHCISHSPSLSLPSQKEVTDGPMDTPSHRIMAHN